MGEHIIIQFIKAVSMGVGAMDRVILSAPEFSAIAAAVCSILLALMFFQPWDEYIAGEEDKEDGRRARNERRIRKKAAKRAKRDRSALSEYTID